MDENEHTGHCAELTGSEVVILNAARNILDKLGESAGITYAGGVIMVRATVAKSAIFDVLSAYRIYGGHPLDDALLHNRTAESIAAAYVDGPDTHSVKA